MPKPKIQMQLFDRIEYKKWLCSISHLRLNPLNFRFDEDKNAATNNKKLNPYKNKVRLYKMIYMACRVIY